MGRVSVKGRGLQTIATVTQIIGALVQDVDGGNFLNSQRLHRLEY